MTASGSGDNSRETFDFAHITEKWDTVASRFQRRAASLRYQLARELTADGTYIELCCGTAFGLAYVRERAGLAVGADLSLVNLLDGKRHDSQFPLLQCDAERPPFRRGIADVVACLEAVYYLPNQAEFVAAAASLLRPEGTLYITAPNPLRPGFNPSAGSTVYPTASMLRRLLIDAGLEPQIFGAFPWDEPRGIGRVVEAARRAAVRMHLLPRTIWARSLVKRLIYRDTASVGALDDSIDPADILVSMPPGNDSQPLITLYAFGRKTGSPDLDVDGRSPDSVVIAG